MEIPMPEPYCLPGLRAASERGEPAVKLMITGAEGRASLAFLERRFGLACAGESAGEPVWATDEADARIFAVPSSLESALPPHGVLLADGITARMVRVDPAGCQMDGPGAAHLLASRGMPGFRQSASSFPTLPASWTAVITVALESGRFLNAGAGQSKPSVIPVTRASRPAAAATASTDGAPAKTARSVRRLDAAEIQRRSAIVEKYGVATEEQRAIVNRKIADGSAP